MHNNFVAQESVDLHNRLFGEQYHATVSNIDGIDFNAFDLDKLADELAAIRSISYPFQVSFHPDFTDKTTMETYYHRPLERVGRTCLDVFNNLMIKSDGSVIPAHGRCFNLTIGNLYEQELPQIWNAPELGGLRKALTKNGGLLPACTRCCSAVG